MHDAQTIKAVYLDIIALAKGKLLASISDKHGVALSTMYAWRKDLRELAREIPSLLGLGDRKGNGENAPHARGRDEEEQIKKANAPRETESEPSPRQPKGRQRDGCYSLPTVAAMVGKSKREVRQIILDHKIKPDAILVKRPHRNVLGYSEESIKRIKASNPKTIDSVGLMEILEMKPHTYRQFLMYIALLAKTPLYERRFPRIKRALDEHKTRATYRFDRSTIPDFQYLKKEFIEENDGRKRLNKDRKQALRALP